MTLINLKIQMILFQVLRYTITLVTHTAVFLFPVKVRAFSLNQELRPANRSVYLTFKVSGKLSCVVAGGCSSIKSYPLPPARTRTIQQWTLWRWSM